LKIKSAVFKYIEAELYDYPQTKQAIEELKEDIIEEAPVLDDVGGNTHRVSNPTLSKTMRLVTNRRLARMEQTVAAIDRVLNSLDPDRRRLVELKYFEKRLANAGVAMELNISDATFYRWRNEIILLVAVELGLANAVEVS